MGKGGNSNANHIVRTISWEEVKEHTKIDDRWIVVDGNVYDITNFQRRHPGGAKIIGHFAGQDASDVWKAMHNDKEYVSKFMKSIHVGKMQTSTCKSRKEQISEDFEELRQTAIKMGLFKTKPAFYIFQYLHILVFELVAYLVLSHLGIGWAPYTLAALILATAQAQAGWTQHDYGHGSVFNNTKLNHIGHQATIGLLKGASSHWWNFRHNQHHAKTNVYRKDPDITLPQVFLIGDHMPRWWGNKKRGFMPYQWQGVYYWLMGPMALLPIYFHLEVIYFTLKRRSWVDITVILLFFIKWSLIWSPLVGHWGAFGLYMYTRFFESFWFTMVTQMSHIPMEVDEDLDHDWVTSNTITTTNVDPGYFNDWFSGHLNYQIEHHLFPTMPRHNYYQVMPLVKSLCKKHDIPYTCKPLSTAFIDICRSLSKSGQLWYDAYHDM